MNLRPLSIVLACLAVVASDACKKSTEPEVQPQTVTDIDGNVYSTVTIGTQVWMVENLRVTHYRNGDPIPNIADSTVWVGLATGAYSDYNNTPSNSTTYGRIYNWHAVGDSRNIAPLGWHVPTDAEWATLTTTLGGTGVAGGKLKEAGATHWSPPNAGATNETGFTAVPGGSRADDGAFYSIGEYGTWLSSTQYGADYAWHRGMSYTTGSVSRGNGPKWYGFSVRCVRD